MSGKKSLIAAFVALTALSAMPLPASAQPAPPPPGYYGPPGLTPQTEEARHPGIVRAIRQLQDTYRELQAAPDDFGGQKWQAMQDIQRAIHSLKRALYYRLHMDDRALDQLLVY